MVPVEPYEKLGRYVARRAHALVEPREHERLKKALMAQVSAAPRRRKRLKITVGLAAALAAAGAAAYLARPAPRDLSCFVGATQNLVSVGAWMSAAPTQPLKLRFSDGTQASLWPEARGRITRLGPYGADLVVEQGRASFDVVHRSQGHWQVSSGPFVIQVTGTRFDIEWQPEKDHFELGLREGHVRVSGCALGAGQELSAGQRIEASCSRKEYRISALAGKPTPNEIQSSAAASALVGSAEAHLQTEPVPEAGSPMKQARDPARTNAEATVENAATEARALGLNWPSLARQGRFADAYAAAIKVGFDAECLARSAPEVSLLGDAARLSGHLEQALKAYHVVRRRWPSSASAALAAFQMGRLEFDQRRSFVEAQGFLRLYLKEQPNGEFAAPALGRLMEAEVHLGRYDAARELAKVYVERYPKGAHAAAAHQVLGSPATGAP